MRKFLQVSFYEMSFYVEILISLILVAVLIVSTGFLAMDMMKIFSSDASIESYLQNFLDQAMSIAIGVELIKMLSKHTSATIIEVLLFAIARHVVVDQSTSLDSLWSILAISALFATRKYLFTSFDDSNNIIVRGSQKVKIANVIARVNLKGQKGELLRDFVVRHLEAEEKHVTIGAAVYLNDVALRVDSMKNGIITRVEIIKSLS
ncbi:phosphate-starvation-inducible PsiE family protein [Streptococcus orisasini]|uniref:phosphate-starvation-inducible PsiE family protein n=1 Tax=Streptococcus orisasini TaxID=1080071 RepID=UPI00070F0C0F|nr:phosphate-starvation-inducible PsiE family protein [Streptococcus orisasini]